MNYLEQIATQFHAQIAGVTGDEKLLRESAWETFLSRGVPTRRVENWRYTPVRILTALPLVMDVKDERSVESVIAIIPDFFDKIVIVDGEPSASLSTVSYAWENHSNASQINPDKHPMAVLNLAMNQGGLTIRVPEGIALDKPLALVQLLTSKSAQKTHYLHHRIVLEKAASAVIVPHCLSTSTVSQSNNVLLEIELQENAHLHYYSANLSNENTVHLEGVHLSQAAGSTLDAFILSSGGRLSRVDLCSQYHAAGASSRMDGVYSVNKQQHTGFHLSADHLAPHCTTHQSVRGIVDGSAKAVFNGRVCVHKGAVKSYSEQSNHNLVLSSLAEVDTKPELEIYNDDVKCAHGATVGQLDEEALFYLLSRGIDKNQALALLKQAFVEQQFTLIDHQAIQDYFRRLFMEGEGRSDA
jgi:Fe-S cluster assembly protein SufD